MRSLVEEIKRRSQRKVFVDTIYFGGGNPALINPNDIDHIIRTVRESFRVKKEVEISLEGNPESLNKHKITGYKEAGVNRLSIGIQSFQSDVLKKIYRISSSRSETTLRDIRKMFENVNIDLIFNIPQYYSEITKRDIKMIPEDINHISYYALSIEPETKLMKDLKDGKIKELPAEEYIKQQNLIQENLSKRGLYRYEISNYARSGYECKHNMHYWRYDNYIGFGAGAVSTMNGLRNENTTNIRQYLRNLYSSNQYRLTQTEQIKEYVMMNLRMINGINIEEFEKRFRIDFWRLFDKYLDENKSFVSIESNRMSFNNEGLCIYNSLISEIFKVLDAAQGKL